MKMKNIPLIIAAGLIVLAVIFHSDVGLSGNFVLMAIIVGVLPYVMMSYFEFQKVRSMEEQLPMLLLDLAETQKSGMDLIDGFKTVSKTDYGKLSDEIKKIVIQMSWGISLQDALDAFSKRTESASIKQVLRIIIESYNSGGDIAKTMETTATNIVAIREAEKDRKSMMSQHVMVMYAIYFIFIGIILGLSKTLIPMLNLTGTTAATGGVFSIENPCAVCETYRHIFCISCNLYSIICKMFSLGAGSICYYRGMFMLMSIIQGIFSGLVAGQIGEGKVIAGVKHSLIMTFGGFAIFLIGIQLGVL